MSRRVAMLLNNEICFDNRVIKMINTLSKEIFIDLYYIDGNKENDEKLFNNKVTLYPIHHAITLKTKILRHSLFCYEYNYFINYILSKKVVYNFIWSNDLPTLFPAYFLAQKLNAKLIYDSHEIYTETINQFFPRNSVGLKKIVYMFLIHLMRFHGKKVEQKIIPKTDFFITVNESILKYFSNLHQIKHGLSIMNLPIQYSSSTAPINYRKQYNWKDDDSILIYQGDLNEGRGLWLLLNVIQQLDDKFKLIIVGGGQLKRNLQNKVKEKQLTDRVKFINTVTLSELPNYTRGADLGINFLEEFNLSKKMASPNKLFEYIHAQLPVICSNTIENTKVLNKYNVGILVPNNTTDIVQKIEALSVENISAMKKNCMSATHEYNWKNVEQLILDILK